MRPHLLPTLLLAILFLPAATPLLAQPLDLRVGITEQPPYAYQDESGNWQGTAIERWRALAERGRITYEVIHVRDEQPETAVRDGRIDVLLTGRFPLDDPTEVDFLQRYATSGLAVARKSSGGIWSTVRSLLTKEFFWIVLSLCILLSVVGTIMWLLERNENGDQFGGGRKVWHGIGDGFWWAGVTMTTIGYGDKAPKTLAGRTVALLWMLVAMAVTASLTAALVSASESASEIDFPSELKDMKVAAVDTGMAADYLRDEGIDFQPVATIEQGLGDLRNDRIDALIADRAPLKYYIDENSTFTVTETKARSYGAAIALSTSNPYRNLLDSLNREVVLY